MRRLVALLLTCAAPVAAAQRLTTLQVVVVDSAGDPLAGAETRIAKLDRAGRADLAGRYTFTGIPEGQHELTVRRVGYVARTLTVSTGAAALDSIRVVLADIVYELDGVKVSAAQHPFVQDFERRRAKGIGTFVTPEDIKERRPSFSSEIFRQLPMVRLVRTPSGYGIRFPTVISIRRSEEDCTPMLWVDGQRAPGMEIDELGANDIFAVEIYRGAATVPSEFITNGRTQCGAVVVWTKRNSSGFRKRP